MNLVDVNERELMDVEGGGIVKGIIIGVAVDSAVKAVTGKSMAGWVSKVIRAAHSSVNSNPRNHGSYWGR